MASRTRRDRRPIRKATSATSTGATDHRLRTGSSAPTELSARSLEAGIGLEVRRLRKSLDLTDVAAKYPDVKFLECDGHAYLDNLYPYYVKHVQPTYALGHRAAELLLARLSGDLAPPGLHMLPTSFLSRRSVAAPST